MNNWSLYLLDCGRQTYVGITTNIDRRLRQHNCEIVGGARSTKKYAPNWCLIMHIEGFSTRSEAMRWEKLLKSRCRGRTERGQAFIRLTHGICPTYKNRPQYEAPTGLKLVVNIPDHLKWAD